MNIGPVTATRMCALRQSEVTGVGRKVTIDGRSLTGHEPTFSSHLHDHATPNAWGTLRGLSNHASLRKQGLAGSLA